MRGVRKISFSVGVVLAILAAVVVPQATAETSWTGRYVATNAPLAYSCDERPLTLPDPSRAEDYCGSCPYDWLLGAEPECYPVDAANIVSEETGGEGSDWGYGGYAFVVYEEHLGRSLHVAATDDAANGPVPLTTVAAPIGPGDDPAEAFSAESCGSLTAPLHEDLYPYWHQEPGEPAWVLYVHVDSVAVTADLAVCVATTGIATGTLV